METSIQTKACTRCTLTKPLTEFHRQTRQRDGYHSMCRACIRSSYPKYERKVVPVTCKTCAKSYTREPARLKNWNGLCRSCNLKTIQLNPDYKTKIAEASRQRLLAQGGIKNAKKFTPARTKGSKNINWRGGTATTVKGLMRTPEALEWRKAVLSRDEHKCVLCGSVDKLEADHIIAKSERPELIFDINNGRTLCNSCHKETPNYGQKQISRLRKRGLMGNYEDWQKRLRGQG